MYTVGGCSVVCVDRNHADWLFVTHPASKNVWPFNHIHIHVCGEVTMNSNRCQHECHSRDGSLATPQLQQAVNNSSSQQIRTFFKNKHTHPSAWSTTLSTIHTIHHPRKHIETHIHTHTHHCLDWFVSAIIHDTAIREIFVLKLSIVYENLHVPHCQLLTTCRVFNFCSLWQVQYENFPRKKQFPNYGKFLPYCPWPLAL